MFYRLCFGGYLMNHIILGEDFLSLFSHYQTLLWLYARSKSHLFPSMEEVQSLISLGMIMKIKGGIDLDPNLVGSLLVC